MERRSGEVIDQGIEGLRGPLRLDAYPERRRHGPAGLALVQTLPVGGGVGVVVPLAGVGVHLRIGCWHSVGRGRIGRVDLVNLEDLEEVRVEDRGELQLLVAAGRG